jgi:hypothetical protein
MSVLIHYADAETGVFVGMSWSGKASSMPQHAGLRAIDVTGIERFDWQSMRFDLAAGSVVDYVPPAPADTEMETFAWDAALRRYVGRPTTAAHWRDVRAERDRRLAACDWIVARSSERGEPVPLDWTVYRQALRDITDQPDPLAIRWPELPA